MNTSKGIVAVVFRESRGKKEFLVLHRVLNWSGWEMLKGSIDEGEKFDDAVKRELFEETGIGKSLSVKKMRAIMRFFDPVRNCNREMHSFLVKVPANDAVSFANNNAREHDAFEWADEETAMEMLTHAGQKKILKSALSLLKRS